MKYKKISRVIRLHQCTQSNAEHRQSEQTEHYTVYFPACTEILIHETAPHIQHKCAWSETLPLCEKRQNCNHYASRYFFHVGYTSHHPVHFRQAYCFVIVLRQKGVIIRKKKNPATMYLFIWFLHSTPWKADLSLSLVFSCYNAIPMVDISVFLQL